MSQKEEILKYMQSNGGITQLQATNSLGCTRLAARIADLQKDGHRIKKEWITVKKRFGGKVRVVRYSLGKENG